MTKKMLILDDKDIEALKNYVNQLDSTNDSLKKSLNEAEEASVTYYHVYDDHYDCGLFLESDLRDFAQEQQGFFDDDHDLYYELMAIDPMTEDIDGVLAILDERDFYYKSYTATSILEVIRQLDNLVSGNL